MWHPTTVYRCSEAQMIQMSIHFLRNLTVNGVAPFEAAMGQVTLKDSPFHTNQKDPLKTIVNKKPGGAHQTDPVQMQSMIPSPSKAWFR